MLKATETQLNLIREVEPVIRDIAEDDHQTITLVQCLETSKVVFLPTISAKFRSACGRVKELREWPTKDLIGYLDSCQEENQETPVEAPQKYRIEGFNGEWVFGCDVPNQEHMCMVFRPNGSAHMVIPKVRLLPIERGIKVRDEDELTIISIDGNDVVVINHMLLPEGISAGCIVEAIKQL